MRNLLVAGAISVFALFTLSASAQETYPARAVTIVVPSPAGGTTDVVARIYAKKLQELLGQPFLVDNRSGANGYIGTQSVLRAPKDGYQLVVMSGSLHSFTPAMVEKMPFDPIEDFALVTRMVSYPYVLTSSTRLPYQNVGDLIRAGKVDKQKISYASFGVGSGPHLVTEWFKLRTGMEAMHVPYKGGGQAAQDVMSGEISMLFNSLPAAMAQIKGTRVRALAVTSSKRLAALPAVPTVAESAPGFEVISWLGLAAAKGTPSSITDKLRAAMQTASRDPAVIAQLETLGAEPIIDASAAQFHAFMLGEKKKWESVVREAKIPREKE